MYGFDTLPRELQEQVVEKVRQQYTPQVAEQWLHPDHLGEIDRPDGRARREGSCHDVVEVFLRVAGEHISRARFSTNGCITTIASANMAMKMAEGRTLAQARAIGQGDILEALGGLPAESEHCAQLAAEALQAAVSDCLKYRAEPWKKLYR
ncbi:MAG: iron-sulfur cluster assembly scaffold protein [Deltaproteobacteria bacterium]|nr:MAG: iron-sulfur cluster assembly scaffold protein [Deltaproteobacteria bacterium]